MNYLKNPLFSFLGLISKGKLMNQHTHQEITVGIQITEESGIQMVKSSQLTKCSVIQMPLCMCHLNNEQNVWYSNGFANVPIKIQKADQKKSVIQMNPLFGSLLIGSSLYFLRQFGSPLNANFQIAITDSFLDYFYLFWNDNEACF